MSRLRVALGFPFGILALGAVSIAHADVYKAPAAAAVFATCDWGGGYIGVDTGLSVDRTRWGFPQNEPDFVGGRLPTTYFDYVAGNRFTTSDRGWVGSLHGGYNFPTKGPIVAGVEVSYTGGNLEKRETSRFDPNDSFTTRIDHLIEVKGRLGYAWNCFMAYGKFGYATGRVETSAVGLTNFAAPIIGAAATEWHQGYTVGGGLEYMITRNIVIGLEYDWINLRDKTESTPVNFVANAFRGSTLTREIEPDTHLFVARLSYKFGGAAYVPLK